MIPLNLPNSITLLRILAVPVVVVGYDDPSVGFAGCERAATLTSDVDVDNEEQGAPVWVCDEPVGGWDAAWDRLVHYSA